MNEKRYSAASLFAELDRNRGSLWLALFWFQGRLNNRFHSVPVWSCVLPLDKHSVFWQIVFYENSILGPALLHKQHVLFFLEPRCSWDGRLWCAPMLVPPPPAIICVLYCKGVNKSTGAPLSVPSVSGASALAFCCVIYARLLPKMSFLSPTAPSACERARHLSVFINFKDALACFCHSLRWFLINFPPFVFLLFPKSVALSLRLSQVLVSLAPSVCIHFPSHFLSLQRSQ